MATPEEEETGPEVAATATTEEVVTMTGLVGGVGREESLFPSLSSRASKIEKESKTKRVCGVLNLNPAIN